MDSNRTVRAMLAGVFVLFGAAVFLGLTVYPFQYGPVESGLLAAAFVLIGVWEFVLGDTSF